MNIRRWNRVGLVCVVAAAWSSTALAAEEQKTLTLDARGLQSLRIDADSGFLHIQGVPGLENIEVVAHITDTHADYRLTLEKEGNAGVLVSDIDDLRLSHKARIDLTIRTPDRLTLVIDDDSGEIRLTGMRAAASIDDDSGSILVRDHRGNLAIDDDSGDIDLQDIVGNVAIEDDSGDVVAMDIEGNIDVRDDSGGIRIKNVSGHVAIRDGSGGITVANVKGGLTVHESGSGGLSTADIQGGVDIRH